ncbi:hypothetical protein Br6_05010 [Rhodococcus sp. Br-6]|nr:hypothetical protein Br6_05010 [Rhodococcus sp. Br-6]
MDPCGHWYGPIGTFFDYIFYWLRHGHLPG